MINRIINLLSSMKFATLLLLIFAFSIGYATFIENDFGSISSKALIYNSWWFSCMLIFLCIALTLNIFKYKLFRKEKLATLAFHSSFIIILLGAGVTRYTGFEGMMRISEGESENTFISDEVFLQVKVHDNVNEFRYDKKLLLSGITKRFDHTFLLQNIFSNYFTVSSSRLSQPFKITYQDFLPNVSDSVISREISGLSLSSSSVEGKSGTEISRGEMEDRDVLFNETTTFKGVNFTLNNQQINSVNFTLKDESISCVSSYDVSIISMPPTGEDPLLYKAGEIFKLNPMSLLTINGAKYMFSGFSYKEKKSMYSASNNMDDSGNNKNRTIDALQLSIEVGEELKNITLFGKKGRNGGNTIFTLGDLTFTISYGPKYYTLPFSIFLNDFILETYPGSMNPASFASEVEVIDGDVRFPYRIFMNNILDYKGYRFFQSSYDPDESGTILSVNHDWWGTFVTYIGYFLMMLAMVVIFFFKKTRFKSLTKKMNKIKSTTLIVMFLFSVPAVAQDNINFIDSLEDYKVDISHSEQFQELLVQHDGRIKPISTFSSEIIRKISRKENLYGQNSTQVFLGIMCLPELWGKVPLVMVQNKEILEELKSEDQLVPFSFFFNKEGHYIFDNKVKVSSNIPDKDKSKYDKELIKVTERVNILFSIINTINYNSNLNIFPSSDSLNNKWENNFAIPHEVEDSIIYSNLFNYYLMSATNSVFSKDWKFADDILNIVKGQQTKNASHILPSKFRINLEILYNKLDIFTNLFMYYFFTGLLMLIFVIISMFYDKKWIFILIRIIKWLIILGVLSHTLGLISRGVIAQHAPWTNGYEAMIYTVWATMLAGLVFSKKSDLTLAATTLVASMLLLFAFVSYLDPTITNVVPVLNSYWLMIHVSVIVASYGFLILGGFLGLLSLILIIFKTKTNSVKLDLKISELTIINEKSITVGLYMLAIGTFLGGIWANESWGRYWGWDPKETWALVSILVYAFILHMRFVPGLKSKFTFNVVSVFAVYSVLMTYFGVNYLLSGLHSYAAGDKVSIPNSVWISVAIVLFIVIIAKIKNRRS